VEHPLLHPFESPDVPRRYERLDHEWPSRSLQLHHAEGVLDEHQSTMVTVCARV